MKHSKIAVSLLALSALITAPQATADNIADCEIILMQTIEDETGNGSAQVASYRPAGDFIASVYNDDSAIQLDIDGLPIRALLCSRKNVVISDADFKLLATGVPFILSQNFDSSKSDLLTYGFKNGMFQYSHKGEPLTEENLATLTARMADFNSRKDAIETLEASRKSRAETAASVKDEATHKDESDDTQKPSEIEIVKIEPDVTALEDPIINPSIDPSIDATSDTPLEANPETEIEIVELQTSIEETVTETPAPQDTASPETALEDVTPVENTPAQDDN